MCIEPSERSRETAHRPAFGKTGLGRRLSPLHLPVPLRIATYAHGLHFPEVSTEGAWGSAGLTGKGYEGNFWGDRNFGGGYSGDYNR